MLRTETPQTIQLADYKVSPFTIETIHLTFELHSTETLVTSKMKIQRNGESHDENLDLNGEELTFISATIDGSELNSDQYLVTKEGLTLKNVPNSFELVIKNKINPEANKALDGLYKSGMIFCTQNEPEGFRRITYYLDRPDVMAKFTTKIIAPKEQYPVLLSNGNPVGEGDLEGGLHWVEWEDPFLKPCYLYALVAGDLGLVQDSYKTMSGRTIDLRIYCDKGNEDRCHHAMESLKKSMKWDEDTFGLEYDLDIYMIVAVDAFNMGAMENKGLNIFNSVYVLAKPETATDANFLGIESVVGHEYFHNWTGNRITCRDWFQLTLKEGLTVYRDQEFSSDLNNRTVQRIQDVERLRSMQFVEDGGPTAHPIKPSSYIEINNFYTATVYEKGAEVIRMVRTMLGVDGFRKGMDKYFELYDGQAVTTEDFLHAMSVANDDFDFSQFKNWYNQAGTPVVEATWKYSSDEKTLALTLKQSCPATPGQDVKKPFHFPFSVGLLKQGGGEFSLNLKGCETKQPQIDAGILHVTKEVETFTFSQVEDRPIVSLNRGFSAPVRIKAPYELEDYFFMMANDSDEFNRYEAVQKSSTDLIMGLVADKGQGKDYDLHVGFKESFGLLIKDKTIDPAAKAMLLTIPSVTLLAQEFNPIDFKAIDEARTFVESELAKAFKNDLIAVFHENNTPGEYKLDPLSIGKRSLRRTAVSLLASLKDTEIRNEVVELAVDMFEGAMNMTEEIAGFSVLAEMGGPEFSRASEAFYRKWNKDTLVMQKWLTVSAVTSSDETFDRVLSLEKSPIYNKDVPNLVRALVGAFSRNHVQFHHESGRGYEFMATKILEMDKINPQVASRLASSFKDYKKVVPELREKMKTQLDRVIAKEDLSKNVYEIVSKIIS